jgi:uncharacterized protein (TIGR00299 family) protein
MRILHFDSVGGASGDMILGALASIGADLAQVEEALRTLPVERLRILAEPAKDHGLAGVRVTVEVPPEGHHHRGLAEISSLVEASGLPVRVKELALRVFTRLAEAEAEVHGTTPDRIHFHEVGAMDSIVDIVGSCLALASLGVDEVSVGPLPLGQGTVACAHGTYPVPAPATLLLLKDLPVTQTDQPYELVTPTGAALLSSWRGLERVAPGSRVVKAGYGLGHRELGGRPNALRAVLYETAQPGDDACLVLACEVDDTVPELIGKLVTRLLDDGALDVFTTPVQMKKQRPGNLITILCRPDAREAMLDAVFRGSTTLGVREHLTRRTELERRLDEVSTPYGTVRVKVGTWRGEEITRSPELEDCSALAEAAGVSVRAVYEAALAQALRAPITSS